MILKGTVISSLDEGSSGKFKAIFPALSQDIITVTYTSPYYTLNNGGMLAVPEEGSQILAFKDSEGEIYYLSTILEVPDNDQVDGISDWSVIGDRRVYSDRGRPQKVTYANQVGAGLHLTRKFNPSTIVNQVDLKSERGKRVSLNDSPEIDAITIRNEHGDGILISSDGNSIHPERSIDIKSVGSQKFVVYQSDITLAVVEGRDINIENYSTGANANSGGQGRFGNVNLRSQNADVTLVSRASDGRVFIVTPNARIQIASNGDIQMQSDGSITLDAANDINLKATNVNIKADLNISSEAGGTISSLSTGVNSLDGAQVHLNSGLSLPAIIPEVPLDSTDYNE